jgi:hypothetical protein
MIINFFLENSESLISSNKENLDKNFKYEFKYDINTYNTNSNINNIEKIGENNKNLNNHKN